MSLKIRKIFLAFALGFLLFLSDFLTPRVALAQLKTTDRCLAQPSCAQAFGNMARSALRAAPRSSNLPTGGTFGTVANNVSATYKSGTTRLFGIPIPQFGGFVESPNDGSGHTLWELDPDGVRQVREVSIQHFCLMPGNHTDPICDSTSGTNGVSGYYLIAGAGNYGYKAHEYACIYAPGQVFLSNEREGEILLYQTTSAGTFPVTNNLWGLWRGRNIDSRIPTETAPGSGAFDVLQFQLLETAGSSPTCDPVLNVSEPTYNNGATPTSRLKWDDLTEAQQDRVLQPLPDIEFLPAFKPKPVPFPTVFPIPLINPSNPSDPLVKIDVPGLPQIRDSETKTNPGAEPIVSPDTEIIPDEDEDPSLIPPYVAPEHCDPSSPNHNPFDPACSEDPDDESENQPGCPDCKPPEWSDRKENLETSNFITYFLYHEAIQDGFPFDALRLPEPNGLVPACPVLILAGHSQEVCGIVSFVGYAKYPIWITYLIRSILLF